MDYSTSSSCSRDYSPPPSSPQKSSGAPFLSPSLHFLSNSSPCNSPDRSRNESPERKQIKREESSQEPQSSYTSPKKKAEQKSPDLSSHPSSSFKTSPKPVPPISPKVLPGITVERSLATSGDSSLSEHHNVLSICLANGEMGAAYYNLGEFAVYMMHDVAESPADLRLIHSLIAQVSPTAVLLSSRADERVIKELSKHCMVQKGEKAVTPQNEDSALLMDILGLEENESEESEDKEKPPLILLAGTFFGYMQGRKRIQAIITDAEETEDERSMTLSFSINLESVQMIRATGALLNYMDTKRVGVELEDFNIKPVIHSIYTFSVDEMLEMDEDTYAALRIFHKQTHPSVYKAGRGGLKEGLSIFKMVNRCKSAVGKQELKKWFQRPLVNSESLLKRQEAVRFFAIGTEQETISSLQKVLTGITNTHGIFNRMAKSEASAADWMALYKTVFYLVHLVSVLKGRNPNSVLLQEFIYRFSPELQATGGVLYAMLDLREMKKSNKVVIREGVDGELDRKRTLMADLPNMLTRIAQEIRDSLRDYITECQIVYLPLVGFLIAIPKFAMGSLIAPSLLSKTSFMPGQNSSSRQKSSSLHNPFNSGDVSESGLKAETLEELGVVKRENPSSIKDFQGLSAAMNVLPGLEFVFSSDNTVHYRNKMTNRLDEELGDLNFQIVDMERDLTLQLEKAVLKHRAIIDNAILLAAQVDCILALAIAAMEFNWTRPRLVMEPVIEVEGGWHPLVALNSHSTVPNPVNSSAESGKLKLITGPNASGKSVYLKQIGIIAFLAHIGSFVPAAKAVIGPIDRIFTRIHTVDCVLDGMSTFARDLKQIAIAQRRATENSLVIADEFGKGTVTEVGLGLLVACLREWAQKAELCPHIFVSTHFHAVFTYVPPDDVISYWTMEVRQNGAELIFLYKLICGVIQHSYASHTASVAGIPQHILDRTQQIYMCLKMGDSIMRPGQSEDQIRNEMIARKSVWAEFEDLEDCPDNQRVWRFIGAIRGVKERIRVIEQNQKTIKVESIEGSQATSLASSHQLSRNLTSPNIMNTSNRSVQQNPRKKIKQQQVLSQYFSRLSRTL